MMVYNKSQKLKELFIFIRKRGENKVGKELDKNVIRKWNFAFVEAMYELICGYIVDTYTESSRAMRFKEESYRRNKLYELLHTNKYDLSKYHHGKSPTGIMIKSINEEIHGLGNRLNDERKKLGDRLNGEGLIACTRFNQTYIEEKEKEIGAKDDSKARIAACKELEQLRETVYRVCENNKNMIDKEYSRAEVDRIAQWIIKKIIDFEKDQPIITISQIGDIVYGISKKDLEQADLKELKEFTDILQKKLKLANAVRTLKEYDEEKNKEKA